MRFARAICIVASLKGTTDDCWILILRLFDGLCIRMKRREGEKQREGALAHKAIVGQTKDRGGMRREKQENWAVGRERDFYCWSYAVGEGYI